MAGWVRNIHTKNYENLIIFVHVRIKNVWDVFFETKCSYKCTKYQFIHLLMATCND